MFPQIDSLIRALSKLPGLGRRSAERAALALLRRPDTLMDGLIEALREALHRLLADAARSDPEAAELLAEISRQRQQGQRQVAKGLARAGALRAGVAERDAADVIHALASPEVYGLLVADRGWSGARYERWLRDTLTQQLLA